jgi:hypothetical protein
VEEVILIATSFAIISQMTKLGLNKLKSLTNGTLFAIGHRDLNPDGSLAPIHFTMMLFCYCKN